MKQNHNFSYLVVPLEIAIKFLFSFLKDTRNNLVSATENDKLLDEKRHVACGPFY